MSSTIKHIESSDMLPSNEREHCQKRDDFKNNDESSHLSSFYNELRNYIVDCIFDSGSRLGLSFTKQKIEEYLDNPDASQKLVKIQMEKDIVFNNINFPERDSKGNYDYLNLLKKIKSAHFNDCKFTLTSLELPELKIFFQNCVFDNNWTVSDHSVLNKESDSIYQNCLFNRDVDVRVNDNESNYSFFKDCNFKHCLNINECNINQIIFNNSSNVNLMMGKISITNSNIESRFVINNCKITSFITENSSFKSKFEFKENSVELFDLFNTNVHGIFDSYKTQFGSYTSKKCIFHDFTGYEQCSFSYVKEELASFEYVTYLSFVNFRNAIFYGGLDLENSNLKESPNFLKVKIESVNTNRETFRIIKNSFDKVGNHIEANKYFALEMKQYKFELSDKPLSQEKIIFWLNEKISNFGMSYIRPLLLIFIFSILYQSILVGYENNFLYEIYPEFNSSILLCSNFFNELALNIIPFKKFLHEGMEFLSLVFYIIFASLIWQTIISIKKHTRSS